MYIILKFSKVLRMICPLNFLFGRTSDIQGKLKTEVNQNLIQQFVVTNCSKERPGSIVNETLNYGILIPTVYIKRIGF